MKFRFYSATYVMTDGKARCTSSELEFESLEAAADFMRKGVIRQDVLRMAFIPVVCEQIDEVVK